MNQFEIPQNLNPMTNIIKVIGVGGGGSNAVKHLYNLNVKNVDFIVCNTDLQHLQRSPIPNKIQLGKNLTKGLGAGCLPERGREAAIESKEDIKRALEQHTEMLFIAAGLGGGTGTGAAPVIAEVAQSLNILTVAIVTLPFKFEGKKKMEYAMKGLEELKKYVDSIIVIPNEKLKEIDPKLKMQEAFAKADDIVSTAAKSIAEIITNNLHINVDFNDVRTVMQKSGTALMGTATASGQNRAMEALKNAINHPLLMSTTIRGSRHILLSITTGTDDITTDEFEAITSYIEQESGGTAEVIPGYGTDESLGDAISITIVATGFKEDLSPVQHLLPSSLITQSTEDIHFSEKDNIPHTSGTNEVPMKQEPKHTSSTQIEEITHTDTYSSPSSILNNAESAHTISSSESHVQDPSYIDMSDNNTTLNVDVKEDNTDMPQASNISTISLDDTSNSQPAVKIIDKHSTEESKNTDNTTIDNLSVHINTLSEKASQLRHTILNLNDPNAFHELMENPAYIRQKKKTTEDTSQKNTTFSNKDHSNYTIDENGNIKPGSPYLNDQVD